MRAMTRGSGRTGPLISVGLDHICLLLVTQLICQALGCNYGTSNELAADRHNNHASPRDTTSTPHVDDLQKTTTGDVNFTDDTDVLDFSSLDFQRRTNEISPINASATANTVSVADSGLVSDQSSAVGQQVPDHVTSLAYLSRIYDSSGHVTKTTNDSATITESAKSGNSFTNVRLSDDVITTSPHDVSGNAVTQNTLVTSRLIRGPTAGVSEGTSALETSTTHVEPVTLQHTSHSGNDSVDQLITSSVTSLNYTSRYHTHALIDTG